ncbi:hypothetical protein MKW94_015944 [Papaver nudicaule]|uniref:Protein LURP-one-related 5-like n=1 Tax=Papaver nudicaule TaxID=74823 RepID=A0AA41W1Q7_PAPNU|nr:hypothetical protein [Papaver nudicaule]
MSKIHPDYENPLKEIIYSDHKLGDNRPSNLTVWKKSSMSFQGTDGFTVFNQQGELVFRVDNYSRKNRCLIGGVVLMDGIGRALMTLRPRLLSMQYQWNGYEGGEDKCRKAPKTPIFSMRRRSICRKSNEEAEIFIGTADSSTNHVTSILPDLRIEGSFRRRKCSIFTHDGKKVAEILRKKVNNTTVVLSDDVFSLVVEPGFNCDIVMAFVVIMDRICQKPYMPVLCSSS